MKIIARFFVAGFSFGEVGCIRTGKKVLCCHFSSDGKLLASAGHDKKVNYNIIDRVDKMVVAGRFYKDIT